jgi:parallel beta-helix repeat protein
MNNNITWNGLDAVRLASSSNNTFFSNNISNNVKSMSFQLSPYNNIINNTITLNGWNGINLFSSSNSTILCNSISSNDDSGISLNSSSNGNNITNNNISNNNYGIYIGSSNSNLIYHNILKENIIQAFDDSNNNWDNGYPSGGNYWNDYLGTDGFSGPYQDQPGSDGIGDTNYSIDSDSKDLYPLMEPIEEIGSRILLNYPANNSVIAPGVVLDFNIYDEDIDFVNYSIDGGIEQTLPQPFDISTSIWIDGLHNVTINTTDLNNHSISRIFFFTIDSIKPIISLNSLANNSIIPSGVFLNFSVIDLNLDQANYSVNSGADIPLSDPFDISTSGWSDGDYTVQINAQDEAGNSNSSWYFFTLDSASPIIILNTPGNNSIIPAGTPLNFSIIESNLAQANYSVNGGLNISLPDPFDISTSGWADGDYTVSINALDVAGNLTISWFFFTIDSTIPSIQLNSPVNNSYIPSGVFLNFSVIDSNLDHTNYSINSGADIPFSVPFDISTSGWSDGDYTVQINALDMAGNSNSSWYFFTIDSNNPVIILNDPLNNSVLLSGIILNFSILDSNLSQVTYSINGGVDTPFLDPYDISTSGWMDGDYTILINATDMAGNLNSSWYFFTLDSAKPTIQLISPLNNSIIPAGTILNFSVLDSNIDLVNYSINGGIDTPLSDPFDISTSGWVDGDYAVQINTKDMVGNTNSSWYFFTVDATSPTILLNSPGNSSIIPSGTLLNFSIDDPNISFTNYSIDGGPDISFADPFDISTVGWADGDYTITINAEDVAGNKDTLWFLFTIDSTKPIILLNSPLNNSIIPSDTILDFLVADLYLDQVNYSVNGGADILLSDPFDISTTGWIDGDYTIQINVLDLAGNSNSSSYFFTMDSTLPQIILNAPVNNSVIPEDTILDYFLMDSHLVQVNYSVNGGVDIVFLDPYNISTVGWSDGDYQIQINTMDSAGNSNSSSYLFTIDSTLPMFLLNTPENNSVIPKGTILDFSIIEPNLDQTNHSVNGGLNISFSAPYNISTVGWIDGDYTIQINAVDLAGNSNSSWFYFTVDSSRPAIVLNNPENNSVIPNSTILNFSIFDPHLTQVNYSIDGGVDTPLADPYNISILGLPDGDYTVQINALDLAENSNSSWYFFTIDSTLPIIIFEAPENNSIVQNGSILNFFIVDTHLMQVNYSLNGGVDTNLSDPFNISTLGWADGDYTIQINTMDLAGNSNSSWYFISLDSTSPAIILNTPQNNSVIQDGTILDFFILDSNLQQANYSVNGGTNIPLSDPFNITTAGLTDENYTIQINALDNVGNSVSAWFFFTIDSIAPEIILNTPENNSVVQGGMILDFSIIDPNLIQANYSINGGLDNAFSDPFNIPTSGWEDGDYTVFIIAQDMAGNSNTLWFFFTIDSTPPTISIESTLNHSIISIGKIIQLNISDPDTNTVMYSINGGEYFAIIPPYNIDTSTFSDGRHMINVTANDTLGNEATIWFEVFIIGETLFSLKDPMGDVMNEAEEQVVGHPDIDMINISIWKVGDYLLYEMSVEGIIHDQIVGSDVYFYSLSLFMDETDDPENKVDKDFTINCSLGLVNIENEDTGETQSLEAFGYGTSTLRLLIPLTFIDDDTDFKISADNIVYINLDSGSGTYDEAFVDTSLDASDLLFDTDNDGIPDDVDDDDDNDGYSDDEDDFPLDITEWLDTDGDGIGNNADDDDDDDGHPDDEDDLPLDDSDWLDTDSDGIGNKVDIDDDGDGYFDTIETDEGTDPLDDNSTPPDNDGDFLPDSIDPDDDDDGVLDVLDDYPFDSTRSKKPSEGGGLGIVIILIIIVIVVVLVVLLFLKKRGKGKEEAPATEEGAIAFGAMEMQEGVPAEGEGAFGLGEGVPTAMPEAATYKCPHCQKPFSAPIYQQAMIAVCPSCGNKTTIGQQKRTEEQQLN